jgi:small-conductance mechanosensitive channel
MTDVAAPRPGELEKLFHYHHHPRAEAHLEGTAPKPAKVRDMAPRETPLQRFNSHFGLVITILVGTMWCAYLFTVIAFLSFWQAVTSHNLVTLVAWISSNFLQLVLLPIIIVGQNLQAKASDKRAENTYEDAEAVLHEAMQIQDHLGVQDKVLAELIAKLEALTGGAARGETATT